MRERLPTLPNGAAWVRDGEQFGIIWAGRRCSPRWNATGPAVAYAQGLWAGTRRPEYEEAAQAKLKGWT